MISGDNGGLTRGRSGALGPRTLERRKSQLQRAVHKTTIISEILDNRTKQLVSVRLLQSQGSDIKP